MTSSNAALIKVPEAQTVVCTGTGGTFTLTYESQTTAALAFDATAAQVQASKYVRRTLQVFTTFQIFTGVLNCNAYKSFM